MRNKYDPLALHLEVDGQTVCGETGRTADYEAWRSTNEACIGCWSNNGRDDSTGEPLRGCGERIDG